MWSNCLLEFMVLGVDLHHLVIHLLQKVRLAVYLIRKGDCTHWTWSMHINASKDHTHTHTKCPWTENASRCTDPFAFRTSTHLILHADNTDATMPTRTCNPSWSTHLFLQAGFFSAGLLWKLCKVRHRFLKLIFCSTAHQRHSFVIPLYFVYINRLIIVELN